MTETHRVPPKVPTVEKLLVTLGRDGYPAEARLCPHQTCLTYDKSLQAKLEFYQKTFSCVLRVAAAFITQREKKCFSLHFGCSTLCSSLLKLFFFGLHHFICWETALTLKVFNFLKSLCVSNNITVYVTEQFHHPHSLEEGSHVFTFKLGVWISQFLS